MLLVIPLYFEANMNLGLPVVNIGISDREQQVQRITKRDGEEGVKRLDKQMSLEEREKRSQCCVRNDGNPSDAAQQVYEFISENKLENGTLGKIINCAPVLILIALFVLVLLLAYIRRLLE